MPISSDFTINYTTRSVTHSSGATVYTVNALYSYLQDTFDELTQMDDLVPMSAQTPTDYTLINGWFMDDNSFKYLKSGAIKTSGYADSVRILTFNSGGYTSAVAGDISKTVVGGTTGDTGVLLAYDNTRRKWWVRMTGAGDLFDTSEAITITTGTGAGTTTAASITGEDLYSNIYTLGTIEQDDSQQIYVIQNGSSISAWWPEGGSGTQHIDVLIKVKEGGVLTDSGKVTVFLRHYPSGGNADLYDNFEITLSAGGRNAVPLATSPDLNNTTATATVSGYSNIVIAFVNGTITHGAVTSGPFTAYETVTWTGGQGVMIKDSSGTMTLGNVTVAPTNGLVLTGGSSGAYTTASANMTVARISPKAFDQGSDYNYSIMIKCQTRTLAQVYEYLKYVTRYTSTYQTYEVKMASAALSIVPKNGDQYITPFTDFDTPSNSFSPTKASPFGTFAGGKFFGARGVWIENMASADIQNFQLVDAANGTQNPPNYQSVTINNLLSGDRVAVFRTSGADIDKAMYTSGAGNNSGNNTFVVSGSIAVDTPSTGAIRVVDVDDFTSSRETRYTYTSWSGSTFSGVSPVLDRTYTNGSDKAYVPFIDTQATSTSETVSVIYTSSRSILVRVRRYTATAILPFETTGTFSSTGYSTSVIRTTDSIVS